MKTFSEFLSEVVASKLDNIESVVAFFKEHGVSMKKTGDADVNDLHAKGKQFFFELDDFTDEGIKQFWEVAGMPKVNKVWRIRGSHSPAQNNMFVIYLKSLDKPARTPRKQHYIIVLYWMLFYHFIGNKKPRIPGL